MTHMMSLLVKFIISTICWRKMELYFCLTTTLYCLKKILLVLCVIFCVLSFKEKLFFSINKIVFHFLLCGTPTKVTGYSILSIVSLHRSIIIYILRLSAIIILLPGKISCIATCVQLFHCVTYISLKN